MFGMGHRLLVCSVRLKTLGESMMTGGKSRGLVSLGRARGRFSNAVFSACTGSR